MDDQELQALLVRWRNWSQCHSDLGFKSITIEYKLMREGVTNKVTGSHEIEDTDCEILDCAISRMPNRMKKVIKLKYLFGWTNKDAARTVKMSLAGYKTYLISSRSWLCGHMSNSKIKNL